MKSNLKTLLVVLVLALMGTGLVLVSGQERAEAEDPAAGMQISLDGEEEAEEEEEEEVEVPLSRVPSEVLSMVRHAVKDIQLREAERSMGDGIVFYELDGEAWGRSFEIDVAMRMLVVEVESYEVDDEDGEDGRGHAEDEDGEEDGNEEEEIDLSKVPEEVKMLVRNTVSGIELTGAEREVHDGVILYAVQGLAWGHTFEVEVALRISVTEIESEDGEDEEEEGDHEEEEEEKEYERDGHDDEEEHGK